MPPIVFVLFLPGIGVLVFGLLMNTLGVKMAQRAAERAKSESTDENMKKAMENIYFIKKMQLPANNMRIIVMAALMLAISVGMGFFMGLFKIK